MAINVEDPAVLKATVAQLDASLEARIEQAKQAATFLVDRAITEVSNLLNAENMVLQNSIDELKAIVSGVEATLARAIALVENGIVLKSAGK